MEEVLQLKEQLKEKERELVTLRKKLAQLEKFSASNCFPTDLQDKITHLAPLTPKTSLTNDDIMRFSRQLILPELGVKGQLALSNTSVLVVGCGGLGCPLAQYLAAAGIGRLGLLDYDEVELSNLHRQVLHSELTQGQPKSQSAAQALRRLNPVVQCVPYHLQLCPENALQLIQQYDIVADCSDNVPTRYLVNDACVLSGKPLVSASALRMEGQLTVYNYNGGPCYRCLYPVPPPPDTVTNCSDGGVLGVVPGIMGCLQALEVLKLASGQGSSCGQHLLMFDGQDCRFRSVRLRPRQTRCAACGEEPSVTQLQDYEAFCGSAATDKKPTVTQLQDYEAFCGSAATDKCRRLNLLSKEQRITVQDYKSIVDSSAPHILLDVRPQVEVDICHLPSSLNIPLASLEERQAEPVHLLKEQIGALKRQLDAQSQASVYVICKQGNDSQKAVQILEKMSGLEVDCITVKDICGGLMAWAQKIEPSFPQY